MGSIIDEYRADLAKVDFDYDLGEAEATARFQLPRDVTHREAHSYALNYGIKHAIELQAALSEIGDEIHKNVHVLDIGCGPGLSVKVLQEANFNVRSYCGIDHAPAQIWLARLLNPNHNFTTDLSVIPTIRETALVVMNHICAQENVSETDLKNWVHDLNRIIPTGFDLLSIEPMMNTPKQDRLISFFAEFGHKSEVLVSARTPGQFRYPKQTKVIRVSGNG